MEKAQKIIIFLISVFLVFSFSISSFASDVAVDNYANYFAIWNVWSCKAVVTTSSTVVQNFADASNTATYVTVGASFPMIPYVAYKLDFQITQKNDNIINWFYGSDPIACYSLQDPLLSDDFNTIAGACFNSAQVLGSSYSFTSSEAQSGKYLSVEFTLMTDKTLSYDYMKLITFSCMASSTVSTDQSYKMQFGSIKIYYDPSDMSAATMNAVENNAAEIEQLGYKVELINTAITDLSNQVTTQINDVKDQLSDSTDRIENKVKAMQDAVTSSVDQAADQAHDDAVNAPARQGEYDKQQSDEAQSDKDSAVSGAVSDLDNDVDKRSPISKIKSFWDALSSTSVKSSLTFPAGDVSILGKSFHFWDSKEIDFSDWLDKLSPLLIICKWLSSIFLISWILRFWYECIEYLLGNTDKSIGDILFGFNPFSR